MRKVLLLTLILVAGLLNLRASGVDANVKNSQTTNLLTPGVTITQVGSNLIFSMPDGPEPVEIYYGSTLVWSGNPADGYSLPINSASWPAGVYSKPDPRHGKIYEFIIVW